MCCEELQLPAHLGTAAWSWGKPSCAWAACRLPSTPPCPLHGTNEGLALTSTSWDLSAQQRSLEASPAPLVQVTTCHLTPLESHCSCLGS